MKYLLFDKRALALMRMAIAAVLMFDLGLRMLDLEAFYSNTGVAPLNMLFENDWNDYFLSIHTISGLWQVQLVLFLFAFFCAVMLFLGYRTRLFTILSWLLLLSLHNRNSLILQGGDDLLRMVLFWGMFMPWGDRYSCDNRLSIVKNEKVSVFTVATFAYLLQICYIYSGSALLKGPEWNRDFTALYYAYSLDQIAYPVTKYWYYNEHLLHTMTQIAYYFELLVPLLFFIPVKHAFFRTLGVFLIIGFHLFNSMTLFIGLFPVIGMSTALGVLPGKFMDGLERRMRRFKKAAAASFMGFAALVSRLVRWKEPRRVWPVWVQRVRMALLIFLTLFVFDWNFSNLTFISSKLSNRLRIIGYGLRLDQNWGMFAPGVFKDDGWPVLEGFTASGDSLDLLRPDAKLDFRKPANVLALYKSDRWRKYFENMIMVRNAFMRGYFCNYTMRTWNEKHPERKIVRLRVIYMGELTLPGYHYSPPVKYVLWDCG